jgi:hypothetical protein
MSTTFCTPPTPVPIPASGATDYSKESPLTGIVCSESQFMLRHARALRSCSSAKSERAPVWGRKFMGLRRPIVSAFARRFAFGHPWSARSQWSRAKVRSRPRGFCRRAAIRRKARPKTNAQSEPRPRANSKVVLRLDVSRSPWNNVPCRPQK